VPRKTDLPVFLAGIGFLQKPLFKFGVKSPTGSFLHDFTAGRE
jgi:hypothetical protein